MKPICVLLAFAYTFSCFRSDVRCTEAVADWLQTDSYRQRSDYRNNICSDRSNTTVNEEEACIQTSPQGSIEFGPDTSSQNQCQIYKWQVNVSGTGVDVTISYLHLNENAGNYLIISPGPSLVRDEASVVITGKIQGPKMFRVIDHNEMTVLLVIPEGVNNTSDNFRLSYESYEVTTATPNTTTPKPTYSTPEPGVDYNATVHVERMNDTVTFNNTAFKEVVAIMANKYCKQENPLNTTCETGEDDVELLLITGCPLRWFNWNKCIRIVMTVQVNASDNKYELTTRKRIEDMWGRNYVTVELAAIGLKVRSETPDSNILQLWLPISLCVAAIFALLMVVLWHFDIFNTSNKKDVPTSLDSRTSNVSKQSWVSNSSYQEVPPMTDLSYDDIYNERKENQETITLPDTLSVSHERLPPSEQFGAAYYFQPQGYDNPSFELSSERHHHSNADYHDEFGSDDDSNANTSTDTKSRHDHLHTATKQVKNEDNNRESAL